MATEKQTAYLALGANLGDPKAIFCEAIKRLSAEIGPLQKLSALYHTAALNPPERPDLVQPDFLNAVMSCATDCSPQQILSHALAIEQALGRQREEGERWGPRLIDIDLLAVEQAVIVSDTLRLPHPEMHKRDFVLYPLSEIAPNWRHPLLDKTITELISDYEQSGVAPTIIGTEPAQQLS